MALGRASGSSAPSPGPTQVLGAQAGDRRVQLYVTGSAQVRLGFTQEDVQQAGAGFAVPTGGVDFILAQGDELWLASDASQWQTRVYLLVTKG